MSAVCKGAEKDTKTFVSVSPCHQEAYSVAVEVVHRLTSV